MVVRHGRTERLPGGAANVARNLQALGASVHLIGVVGDDPGAEMLEACLREQGLHSVTLVKEGGRATTRKVRVLADATHQTLRIDFEDDHPVGAATASEIVDAVRRQTDGAQVLLLSDYVKGALTEEVVQGCIEAVTVPVVANAKPESIERYRGIELVSVNRAEATKALGRSKPIERSEAVAAAREARAMLAPLYTGLDIWQDENFRSRGFWTKIEHPELGTLPMLGRPFILPDSPWRVDRPAPSPGQHTDQVLADAGFTTGEVSSLRAQGVVA